MSGSCCQLFLFMVAFRYPTANCKILTCIHHYLCLMYWPPSGSKVCETHSLPDPEIELQWSVHNFWSCIMGKRRGTGHSYRKFRQSLSHEWISLQPLLGQQHVESLLRHWILSPEDRECGEVILANEVVIWCYILGYCTHTHAWNLLRPMRYLSCDHLRYRILSNPSAFASAYILPIQLPYTNRNHT